MKNVKRGAKIEIANGMTISRVDHGNGEVERNRVSVEVRDFCGGRMTFWRDELATMIDLIDGRPVADLHGVVHTTPDAAVPPPAAAAEELDQLRDERDKLLALLDQLTQRFGTAVDEFIRSVLDGPPGGAL